MGRVITIYQIEESIVAEKLTQFLQLEHIANQFKQFLIKRAQDYQPNYTLNYQHLMETVKDGFKRASAADLFEIVYFLEEEVIHSVDQQSYEFLKTHGVDLIYQSSNKSEAHFFILL